MGGGEGGNEMVLITDISGADTMSHAQLKAFNSIDSFHPHYNPMKWKLLSSPLTDGENEAHRGCTSFLLLL